MIDEQKHSPGPFTVESCYDGGRTICQMRSTDKLICVNAAEGASPAGYDATEANARLLAAAPDMLAALEAISSNPHCDLGDLVYRVRESEGEGWDGPAVIAWSNAVEAVRAAISKAKGAQ